MAMRYRSASTLSGFGHTRLLRQCAVVAALLMATAIPVTLSRTGISPCSPAWWCSSFLAAADAVQRGW